MALAGVLVQLASEKALQGGGFDPSLAELPCGAGCGREPLDLVALQLCAFPNGFKGGRLA